MTDTWRKLDEEVAATPMPEIYLTKMVRSRPDALSLSLSLSLKSLHHIIVCDP